MTGTHKIAALAAAVAALTLSGCEKYGDHGNADVGAITKAIQADEKKWNDEFKSKDMESLIGHYADDAYFVAPGTKPATGSTEIRRVYTGAMTDPSFSLSFASDKVDVAASGDMAYARGHFTEKYTDPKTQKVMTGSGSYITVYKKQQDGSWKAVEDFAAADPDSIKPVEPGKAVLHAQMQSF